MRRVVSERLHDEDLPRRVGEVLLRADDVRDPEVVVVHRARQVIERRAVGALNHVVLLEGPVERDGAAHQIVERARALARHPEADHRGAAFGFEARRDDLGLRHPATAIDEARLRPPRRFALRNRLGRRRVVPVRAPARDQGVNRRAVAVAPFRLEIRAARSAHLRSLIPVDPEPAEAVEDRLQRLGHVPLAVGVVDAEDERSAVPSREEPVE